MSSKFLVVGRTGFEPVKAEPADLQSAAFDRFATGPHQKNSRSLGMTIQLSNSPEREMQKAKNTISHATKTTYPFTTTAPSSNGNLVSVNSNCFISLNSASKEAFISK